MSKTINKKDSATLKTFRKIKVIVIEQLAKFLGYSIPTIRRRLKQWHTHTSYNQNGRYYVLPETPDFDQNGLWHYKNIFFSKYGNLKKTVICLVNNSPAGLTATEIGKIVGVSPRSFLSHLSNTPQLHREKIDSRFVYLSPDKVVLANQKQKREEDKVQPKLLKLPTDTQSVIILVEKIKYPHLDIEQLSMKLSKEGYRIKPEVIFNLLEYHGLLKKK